MQAASPDQIAAIASPLRMELLGLFTHTESLAVADMADLMGRPAGSLYYHVEILESVGLLERCGKRPKGKRFETLFRIAASRIDVTPAADDPEAVKQTVKIMAAAFRMAERELDAALRDPSRVTDGPGRNLLATHLHLRLSPDKLAELNDHLRTIEKLLSPDPAVPAEPAPDDQHLSLTLALLPIKGRNKPEEP